MINCVEKRKTTLLGKLYKTNNSGECVLIDYRGAKHVTVKFFNPECFVTCELSNLLKGKVQNPLLPTFYNRGYIGVGKYSKKNKAAYTTWTSMLKRAYSFEFHTRYPTYKDVTVCSEWLNFQNFAEWFYNQEFSEAKDEKGNKYHLDKDILDKGDKVYSPQNCCFIPQELNGLFRDKYLSTGNLPKGVHFVIKKGRFRASLSVYGKTKHLGYFETQEEAFQAYKKAKESYVKEVVEDWKGLVSSEVYQAITNTQNAKGSE